MKPTIKGINLLPKEYIQAQKIRMYLLIAAAALVLECILFIITVVLPPIAEIDNQEAQIIQLQQELASPKFAEVNKTIEELNVAKDAVQKWVDKCNSLKKPNFVSGKLFDELTARLPQGVTIDKMSTGSGEAQQEGSAGYSISLSGKTQTGEALLHYVAILESVYKGAKVSFNLDDAAKDKLYQSYTITVAIPVSQAPPATQATQPATGVAPEQVTPAAEAVPAQDSATGEEAQS